jgi:hypothetical protein
VPVPAAPTRKNGLRHIRRNQPQDSSASNQQLESFVSDRRLRYPKHLPPGTAENPVLERPSFYKRQRSFVLRPQSMSRGACPDTLGLRM